MGLYFVLTSGVSSKHNKPLRETIEDRLWPGSGHVISYGENGVYVGNDILPRDMYNFKTSTTSKVRSGLLPLGHSVLLPVCFHDGADDVGKKRAIENVLEIMDDRSPETAIEAFGAYVGEGEDISISVSNPTIANNGHQRARFGLKLHSRMANLYLAEAMAKMGDTRLLTAYFNSYADMLVTHSQRFGKNKENKIDTGITDAVASIDTYEGYVHISKPTLKVGNNLEHENAFRMLRFDQKYHEVLDSISKYCNNLDHVHKLCLHALRRKVNEAEKASPVSSDEELTWQFFKIIRKDNFPFVGDTAYTRALEAIEGYDKETHSYYEDRYYCFDGWISINRGPKEHDVSSHVDSAHVEHVYGVKEKISDSYIESKKSIEQWLNVNFDKWCEKGSLGR